MINLEAKIKDEPGSDWLPVVSVGQLAQDTILCLKNEQDRKIIVYGSEVEVRTAQTGPKMHSGLEKAMSSLDPTDQEKLFNSLVLNEVYTSEGLFVSDLITKLTSGSKFEPCLTEALMELDPQEQRWLAATLEEQSIQELKKSLQIAEKASETASKMLDEINDFTSTVAQLSRDFVSDMDDYVEELT